LKKKERKGRKEGREGREGGRKERGRSYTVQA
jgi:hypothetical protein